MLARVLTFAAILGLVGAPRAIAAPRTVKVITHNIAGGHKFDGRLTAVDAAVRQAKSWRPDVVMLEEVCEAQARALRDKLPEYHYVFTPMLRHNADCHDHGPRFGQVLASRWPLSGVIRTNLHGSAGTPRRHFTLTCALVAASDVPAGRLRACVTHLRAHASPQDKQARSEQVHRIRRTLHKRIAHGRERVIVAGDFNARPQTPVLDEMYRLKRVVMDDGGDGIGDFVEGDQTDHRYFANGCGPPACRSGDITVPGKCTCKFDYVFFSRLDVRRLSGRALDGGGSDHNLYRASARFEF